MGGRYEGIGVYRHCAKGLWAVVGVHGPSLGSLAPACDPSLGPYTTHTGLDGCGAWGHGVYRHGAMGLWALGLEIYKIIFPLCKPYGLALGLYVFVHTLCIGSNVLGLGIWG